jgi:threonine dehydrogenase-like Zn-dependent dehydrogenase
VGSPWAARPALICSFSRALSWRWQPKKWRAANLLGRLPDQVVSGTRPFGLSAASGDLARQIEDKRVLITGGSSGIGLETARRVAAAGARTIICGRDPQRLADARRRIGNAGGHLSADSVDLADLADCGAFVQRLLERHGGVDILINNAGRSIRRSVQDSLDRFHEFQRTRPRAMRRCPRYRSMRPRNWCCEP